MLYGSSSASLFLLAGRISKGCYLNQSVSVAQMHDGIAFQSAFVPVMVYLSVQRFGKYAQISYAQGFEKEAHRIQVIHQVGRT